MYIFHGIKEIINKFDFFLIDLWGVLHDGDNLYPKAFEALQKINEAGKKVVFVSNAPRKNEIVLKKLNDYKIPSNYYLKVVTSGDVAFDFFQKNPKGLGYKYYYVGPEKDLGLLEGLENYKMEEDPKKADFIMAVGFNNFGDAFETKKDFLDNALLNSLPMICVNPDKFVVKQSGSTMLCAGEMAKYYEQKGGEVIYFGKPYEGIFEKAVKNFTNFDKQKAIMIGDGIETDVKGANKFGIKSLFVLSGIASKELKYVGDDAKREDLKTFVKKYEVEPYAIIPSFSW
jgi:HAD superfamily hydrolase (TIGR01459 family)